MSEPNVTDVTAPASQPDNNLKRSITGRLLFFYVLGDVLGSGIYVLIGSVAGAVGGAFWIAFAVGVSVATITGLAYAELVTKYPQAAGAALYVNKAFKNRAFTFFIAFCMLSASFAAAGSLATGFASYFIEVWGLPPELLLALVFILVLAAINFIGITESVVANLVMTIVEVGGLIIVMIIGVIYIAQGKADFGTLVEFDTGGKSPLFAVVAGVALAFFAMTGFENAANVAEETVEPQRTFPRALVGGMVVAGILYVLVAMTSALVVPIGKLAGSDAALLEVIKADILPIPVGIMTIAFAIIAMIAITNTCLVALVTESRILYGMAREDVVPGVFSKVHKNRRSPWVALIFAALIISALLLSGADLERLVAVTVIFTLFIYALVIIAALKLRHQDVDEGTFSAPLILLVVGILGNAMLFGYVVYTDPTSLIYCAALLGVGAVLFVFEHFFGNRSSSASDMGV